MSGPWAAVVGMVLVVLVAAVLFGARVGWARAASAPRPVQPTSGAAAGTSGAAAGGSAVAPRATVPGGFATRGGLPAGAAGAVGPAGSTAPSTGTVGPVGAAQVVVHVVGQVRQPGVVVLAPGARVRDAVDRAGGALPGADLGAVNLARPLVDGEQVRVPRPGEVVAATPGAVGGGGRSPAGGGGSSAGGGGDSGAAGSAGGSSGPVNLNTANQSVLEELPGVGPVLAKRIIDWRTAHGRFTSVDELAEVSGIGEKMFAQLQGKVTV